MKRLLYLLVLLLAACGKGDEMAIFDIVPSQFNNIDLRDTLNANGGNIPADPQYSADFFNEKAKINKWSKNKPVRSNSLTSISDEERRLLNYGIDIQAASDYSLLELFRKAAINPSWDYLPPRGGSSEPYRISDFQGYKPNAEAPFNYDSIPSRIPTIYEAESVVLKFNVNPNVDINIGDFSYVRDYPADNWYYAVAYKKFGSNEVFYSVGPNITATWDITIAVPLSLGLWECLFMATTLTDPEPNYVRSIYMPNGLFEVQVYKEFRMAVITINSGFEGLYMDNNAIYGLSTVKLSIQSETSASVPPTYWRLDLLIYTYDLSGKLDNSFYVVGSPNGDFGYSGVSASTYSLDYLGRRSISFSDYDINGLYVSRCEVIPQIVKMSGDGSSKFAGNYNFPANR